MGSRYGYSHILIIGKGAMAARCGAILLASGFEVDEVWESGDEPFSSLPGFARAHGLGYFDGTGPALWARLRQAVGDALVFSINNDRLIPKEITDDRRFRIVNFHNAPLPRYPGRNVPTWVVYNGEYVHGATWHRVDGGVDTGNILSQALFPVGELATAQTVMLDAIRLGVSLFERDWEQMADPDVPGAGQSGRARPYKAAELPRAGHLDLDEAVICFSEADRWLRAFDYGPFAVVEPPRLTWEGNSYRVRRYRARRGGGEVARPQLPHPVGEGAWRARMAFPEGTIELQLGEEA